MNLTKTSKLLAVANESDYYVMIYHGTPVVYMDRITGEIRFKHNGWETKATAQAMNYALDDIYEGLPHQRVSLVKGELKIDKTTPIENGETFHYLHLEVA
jgi:hypothetical protein